MQVIHVKNKPDKKIYISQPIREQLHSLWPVKLNMRQVLSCLYWNNVNLCMHLRFLDKTAPEPQARDFLI